MNETKSILVTGCSSGIGRCVAIGLKQRGYRVFASARQQYDVDELHTWGLEALQLDLDDSASIQSAVAEVLERSDGKLYGLFNNGAYGQPGAVEDLSREVLRAQFETNLFGWLELTNLILPAMRKQGQGRIIQNSSVLGLIALPYRGAYNASKYALEGLSDTLRLELANTGIYLSLIEPGPIESAFRRNAFTMFKKNIDPEHSAHRHYYDGVERRLARAEQKAPFTLPPEAVLKKVIHALESKRPKVRYYVTFPTYLFGTLRRLLPSSWLDKVLLRVSAGENK